MKHKILFILFIVFILFSTFVVGYSTYGAPSEFGNETNTTCYIGGDYGIVNCTGQGIFGGGVTILGNYTGSISAANVDRDIPSNCSDSFAVIGWDSNLSTTYCAEFLQTANGSIWNKTGNIITPAAAGDYLNITKVITPQIRGTLGELIINVTNQSSSSVYTRVYEKEILPNTYISVLGFGGDLALGGIEQGIYILGLPATVATIDFRYLADILESADITYRTDDTLRFGNAAAYLYDNEIKVTGNVNATGDITTNDLFLGQRQLEQDQFIYFYEDGSPTGEYIKWDDGVSDRFYVSDSFFIDGQGWVTGIFYVVGDITTDGDVQAENVNVANNITAGGNITADNVFLLADISAHTNATIPVAAAGVWHNVTFDEEAAAPVKDILHTHNDATNDTFTIVHTGTYKTKYTVTFEDSNPTPGTHVVARLIKNGVEIDGSLLEEDSTRQYAEFTIGNGPHVDLIAGDKIKVQFTASDTSVSMLSHLTYGEHRDSATLKMVRIR